MRSGMIPTVSGMATAGVASLPVMMTEQIPSGAALIEAVKYRSWSFS
jgi:ABC-type iron transport system FetAB permease component